MAASVPVEPAAPVGWPEWADGLDGFLAELRRGHGFRFGLGEEVRAFRLLDLLVRRGIDLADPARAVRWLAPVLATSPAELAEFRQLFLNWSRAPGRSGPAARPREVAPPPKSWGIFDLAALFGGIVTAIALVGLVAWQILGDGAPSAPITTPPVAAGTGAPAPEFDPLDGLPWLRDAMIALFRFAPLAERVVLGTLALLPAIAFLGWSRARGAVLTRGNTLRDVATRRVSFRLDAIPLFPRLRLQRSLQALRRHRRVPSGELDAEATVRATLASGGRVELRYGTRRQLLEYVLLVQRESASDHRAGLADLLANRFDVEHVRYTRYEYFDEPRRLRRTSGESDVGEVAELGDLAARHAGQACLIVADAASAFDRTGSQPADWLDELAPLTPLVLLTPDPRPLWGPAERRLADLGVIVLPLTPAGLDGLGEVLRADRAPRLPAGAASANDPPDAAPMSLEGALWLSETAPAPAVVAALLAELERRLPASTFELLCALAVFPKLDRSLTFYLGGQLRDAANAPLLDEAGYGALSGLPWLRRGRMPDWLRRALVRRLGRARRDEVRRELQSVLQQRGSGAVGPLSLDIAVKPGSDWLGALLARIRADSDSSLRDVIFLSVLQGREPPELGVVVSREITRLLRRRLDPLEWTVVGCAIAIAGAMALFPNTAWGIMRFLAAVVLGESAVYIKPGLRYLVENFSGWLTIATIAGLAGAVSGWLWSALRMESDQLPERARPTAIVAMCSGLAAMIAAAVMVEGRGTDVDYALLAAAAAVYVFVLVSPARFRLDPTAPSLAVGLRASAAGWGALPRIALAGGLIALPIVAPSTRWLVLDGTWWWIAAAAAVAACAVAVPIAIRALRGPLEMWEGALIALTCVPAATLVVALLMLGEEWASELATIPAVRGVLLAWIVLALWRHGLFEGGVALAGWVVLAGAVATALATLSGLDWQSWTLLLPVPDAVACLLVARRLGAGSGRILRGAAIYVVVVSGLLALVLVAYGEFELNWHKSPKLWMLLDAAFGLLIPTSTASGIAAWWALRAALREAERPDAALAPRPRIALADLGALLALPLLTLQAGFLGNVSFTTLVLPVAAWLGSRLGSRAPSLVAVAMLPMLVGVRFHDLDLALGGGLGLWLSAILVARLFSDALYMAACTDANRITARNLFFLALPLGVSVAIVFGLTSSVSIAATLNPVRYAYLLLFLLGLSAVPAWRTVSVVVAAMAFALALRAGELDRAPLDSGPLHVEIAAAFGAPFAGVTALVCFGVGRLWRRELERMAFRGSMVWLCLGGAAALWLAASVLPVRIGSQTFVPVGRDAALALAFVAGFGLGRLVGSNAFTLPLAAIGWLVAAWALAVAVGNAAPIPLAASALHVAIFVAFGAVTRRRVAPLNVSINLRSGAQARTGFATVEIPR